MSRLIDSPEALAAGVAALRRLDPDIDRIVRAGAEPALRKREAGFAGLAAIVVGQQVSTASAAAILGRLETALPCLTAEAVTAAPDEMLLGIGLSRPKLRTFRAVASAVTRGEIALGELAHVPAEEAHRRLTAIHGIGPWTADIFLLFCLGHPDIFPSGDLALQEAARLLLALPARPDTRRLATLAERWRPWRGVAAYVLWAHYRQAKSREGAPIAP